MVVSSLHKKMDTHNQLFSALRHPQMPTQHALLILRQSALPRLNFLLRTLPPSLTTNACQLFDQLVLGTATHILGLSPDLLTQEALALLRLPLKCGGFGFRSMVSVAPAAYLGSLAAAASTIASVPRPAHSAPHSPALLTHIAHSYRLIQPGQSHRLPHHAKFISHFARADASRLQHRLCHASEAHTLKQLKSTASLPLLAH